MNAVKYSLFFGSYIFLNILIFLEFKNPYWWSMCNYALWLLIPQGKTKANEIGPVTVITSIKSKSVWNKYFWKLRSRDVVFM